MPRGTLAARTLITFWLAAHLQAGTADSDEDFAALSASGSGGRCADPGLCDEASLLQAGLPVRQSVVAPKGGSSTTTKASPPAIFYNQMTVRYYPTPGATETHEMAVIPEHNILLVSQITSSRLVLMPFTEQGMFFEARSFPIGTPYSGLHGLWVSDKIKGEWGNLVEMTLQHANKVLLVEVASSVHINLQPNIKVSIQLDDPTAGPHRTTNLDGDIWVTCKESQTMTRIQDVYYKRDNGEWAYRTEGFKIKYYDVQVPAKAQAGPIFAYPLGGQIYATLDAQGAIARIDPLRGPQDEGAVNFIHMPANCSIPVGMTEGPNQTHDPALWFTCGKQPSGAGIGTFGRLAPDDSVEIYQTSGKGEGSASTAAYLHLAWGPSTTDGYPMLLLVASSIFGQDTKDGVTRAIFDPGYTKVLKAELSDSFQQGIKNHRVISLGNVTFVDGTASSTITSYHVVPTAYKWYLDVNSDYAGSAGFHHGMPSDRVVYGMEGYGPTGACDGTVEH